MILGDRVADASLDSTIISSWANERYIAGSRLIGRREDTKLNFHRTMHSDAV